MAFALVKAMQADGPEWGESYRRLGRKSLAAIIQGRMAEAVDCWLDSLDGMAMRDGRNGTFSRHLLSELGDIELRVPRDRRFCPTKALESYARRRSEIDRFAGLTQPHRGHGPGSSSPASCSGSVPARSARPCWHCFAGPQAVMSQLACAEAFGQVPEEPLAQLNLLHFDEFVGLMRLIDVTGSANDRRNASLLKVPRLGAKPNLVSLARPGQCLCQPDHLIVLVGVQSNRAARVDDHLGFGLVRDSTQFG